MKELNPDICYSNISHSRITILLRTLHVSYIFLHTYLCKIILQITITETDYFRQNHPNVFRNKRIRKADIQIQNTKCKRIKIKEKK